MSRWTHSICDTCWIRNHPTRQPVRMTDAEPDLCCFCEKEHTSGIYTRWDPAILACGGVKGTHAEGGSCPS